MTPNKRPLEQPNSHSGGVYFAFPAVNKADFRPFSPNVCSLCEVQGRSPWLYLRPPSQFQHHPEPPQGWSGTLRWGGGPQTSSRCHGEMSMGMHRGSGDSRRLRGLTGTVGRPGDRWTVMRRDSERHGARGDATGRSRIGVSTHFCVLTGVLVPGVQQDTGLRPPRLRPDRGRPRSR